jgi:nitroreductase
MPDEIGPELISLAAELIHSRQTTLPKRLLAPGPSEKELQAILGAASSAPDHGQLLPWRFIMVADSARARLAEAFGGALLARDALATPEQVSQAQEKAFRAPCLLLVVVDANKGDPAIDLSERTISAGCAVQNILLMAHAYGFGSGLTSGKALKSDLLRDLFSLQSAELALCFISLGSVQSQRPHRVRPKVSDYLTVLQ